MEEMLLDDWKDYPQDDFAMYLYELLETDPSNNTEMKIINDSPFLLERQEIQNILGIVDDVK